MRALADLAQLVESVVLIAVGVLTVALTAAAMLWHRCAYGELRVRAQLYRPPARPWPTPVSFTDQEAADLEAWEAELR